jgi:hypothetical protein
MKTVHSVSLVLLCASLLVCSNALTLNHEYVYDLWSFINGRNMTLSPCFTVLAPNPTAFFLWQPNNLQITGSCGTGNCAFTLNNTDLSFTLGSCTGNIAAPCTGYITRIRTATRISLVSNLINFFSGANPAQVFVLENVK